MRFDITLNDSSSGYLMNNDQHKPKEQLIRELHVLRSRVAELEAKEVGQALGEIPVQLERLGALQDMTAGISHNMNNILHRGIADGQRAVALVQRLQRAMLGEETDELYPVYLDATVRQAIEGAKSIWTVPVSAKGVAIEVREDLADVPPIWGKDSGLHDILLTLLLNAVDAMQQGGTITVRTETVEKMVQLSVSDSGTGMDERTLQQVFEPFFTTKLTVGPGLGLSEVWGMVTRWGGIIKVESTPGKGSTFRLRFRTCTEPQLEEDE